MQLKEDRLTGYPKTPASLGDEQGHSKKERVSKKVSLVINCLSDFLSTVEQSKDANLVVAPPITSCQRKKVRARRCDPAVRKKITWWFSKTPQASTPEFRRSPSNDPSPNTPAPERSMHATQTPDPQANERELCKKRRRGLIVLY